MPVRVQVREGILAVATRLKARGKVEAAGTGRRRAGSAAEEEEEGEEEAMEE